MENTIRIGILRETKNPPDRRVPLTPSQIIKLQEIYPNTEFYVQPSDIRCYSDEEYEYLDIPLKEDLSNCDILMGVKEVDKRTFIADKTYLFFSHVTKKQPYNQDMFRELVGKRIRLIDYEYLTTESGTRIVAFGRWAGIVGAYNALRARGIRTNRFKLKPAYQCRDLEEMWAGLSMIQLKPGLKILITGEGRVAGGAMETLSECGIVQVQPEEFLSREFDVPVVCQIGPADYVRRKDGSEFNFSHFVKSPGEYESTFLPFTRVTDILVACHFWDPSSPKFFEAEDTRNPYFRISVVADISCDIKGPIPTTLRATTIADPFYGYNPQTGAEEVAFTRPTNITVMSIDNLPGELPRDASGDFGRQLINSVLNDLLSGTESDLVKRATITANGALAKRFEYLKDYLEG
ncbi:MAG: alanine dehydrogenase [Bacteroidales bacterium]|nr:alanine dehydrogenase [Bacteroidales bacterium]